MFDLFNLIITIFLGPGFGMFFGLLAIISGVYGILCQKGVIRSCDKKKFLKKIMIVIGAWVVIAILSLSYAFFDALVLGEERGFIHHDKASCIYEDYVNAKDYFSSKEGVAEVKWNEDPRSITIVFSEIKVGNMPFFDQYEGCDLIFKNTEGDTIKVGL
jgi:hypothetical protein